MKKLSMIQKVKYGLAFLAGAIYTSAWWCLLAIPSGNWRIVPFLIVGFGGAGIFAAVVTTIIIHWND